MSRRIRTILGGPTRASRGRGAGPGRARFGRPGRGGPGRGPRRGGRSYRRRSCYFCETKEPIDYKNTQVLRRFTGDTGRICSSTIEFQLSHSGHRPSHFLACAPQV